MKSHPSIIKALAARDFASAREILARRRRNSARSRRWPAPSDIKADFYQGVSNLHEMRAFFGHTEPIPDFSGQPPGSVSGFCYLCRCEVEFLVDVELIRREANWRETLKCPGCGLINRWRSSLHLFEALIQPTAEDRVYLTEAVTPLFKQLAARHPECIGSEYFAEKPPGTEIPLPSGLIRNEDVTCLTFPDGCFEAVLSFDVLEHVPDFRRALSEFYRVLAPGGQALISVPFTFRDRTVTRAEIDPEGNIRHLMEPVYHGDPLSDDGVLCYYEFGLELLQELRGAGFREAYLLCFSSLALGYYDLHVMFVGRKRSGIL